MKIAQVAPLYESVPPKYYGGTERAVSYLTEELVRQGHEVTLFASGDSETKATLAAQRKNSLRLDKKCVDGVVHHALMAERVYQRADEFDIIHSHMDYLPYALFRRCATPSVTTLHGRLDLPDLIPLYQEFLDINVISISNAQRDPLPWINWRGTVYHGLPPDLYKFNERHGAYLAFIGRISLEKRLDVAIDIAIKAGVPLKIAAKVDKTDQVYFENIIEPLLKHPLIEYIGEIGENEKQEFLGNALGLAFPIGWPEPFGLVMIEAMACGTPVIAYPCGSVPEIMAHGQTGFICSNVEEAVEAVKNLGNLNRWRCRQIFELRFSVERMAEDYVNIYKKLTEQKAELVSAA